MKDYDEVESLINEINNRIKSMDFSMFFTLQKSLDVFDSYNFDVNKDDLLLLKWAIDITNSTQDKDFISEVENKDLNSYSYEWLIFLSMNLLQKDIKKQKLSIMILNYLIGKEGFVEKYSDKIDNDISLYIRDKREKDNRKIRYDLLEILGKLKTNKGFYNIVNFIYEEGLSLVNEPKFSNYISKNIKNTKEFRWISELEETSNYVEPKAKLKPRVMTFALMEKSPKVNYQILSKLQEYNRDLYFGNMKNFSDLIANKLKNYEDYIKLMIILDYQCKDGNVKNKIKQYENENSGLIKAFIKVCDSDLLEGYYIKNIKKAYNKNDNLSIITILEEIEEPQIKSKCSLLIFERLIESDFEKLVSIWEYLSLDIENILRVKEKVLEMFIKKEIKLTEQNIGFANKIGLDPVILYNSIDDEDKKEYLLNIWYQSGEIGKITDIVKEKMTNKSNCLDDIKDAHDLLEKYGISNHGISVLIKIKSYTFISIELLELSIESEETIGRLNYLADQLNFYGLIDRFLMDELLHSELDKRILDYLFRRFMDTIDSDGLWQYCWNNIIEDFTNCSYGSSNGKMEIFFTYLVKSKQRIEWFLDIVDNANIDDEIYISILETLLVLMNKQNRIILQNKQEIDRKQDEILTSVGMTICKALSNMERTIINRSNDIENDILVENLKKLRRELKNVGIDTVENIENYGNTVEFDGNIHEDMKITSMERGVVDSLGIRINGKNILLSTLLNID